jgi:hypothetical protein
MDEVGFGSGHNVDLPEKNEASQKYHVPSTGVIISKPSIFVNNLLYLLKQCVKKHSLTHLNRKYPLPKPGPSRIWGMRPVTIAYGLAILTI